MKVSSPQLPSPPQLKSTPSDIPLFPLNYTALQLLHLHEAHKFNLFACSLNSLCILSPYHYIHHYRILGLQKFPRLNHCGPFNDFASSSDVKLWLNLTRLRKMPHSQNRHWPPQLRNRFLPLVRFNPQVPVVIPPFFALGELANNFSSSGLTCRNVCISRDPSLGASQLPVVKLIESRLDEFSTALNQPSSSWALGRLKTHVWSFWDSKVSRLFWRVWAIREKYVSRALINLT